MRPITRGFHWDQRVIEHVALRLWPRFSTDFASLTTCPALVATIQYGFCFAHHRTLRHFSVIRWCAGACTAWRPLARRAAASHARNRCGMRTFTDSGTRGRRNTAHGVEWELTFEIIPPTYLRRIVGPRR